MLFFSIFSLTLLFMGHGYIASKERGRFMEESDSDYDTYDTSKVKERMEERDDYDDARFMEESDYGDDDTMDEERGRFMEESDYGDDYDDDTSVEEDTPMDEELEVDEDEEVAEVREFLTELKMRDVEDEEMMEDDVDYLESDKYAKEMQSDQLSLVTRYMGVGYNLIKGSPDGDFNAGGIDPGIKITRHIFRFSYKKNKKANYLGQAMKVPDQVNFQALEACSSSKVNKVYSGAQSYRNEISVAVEAEGSSGPYSFSASAAVKSAEAATKASKKVFMDQKQICNHGRARYQRNANAQHSVTGEFYQAVTRLPIKCQKGGDKQKYQKFVDKWGTNVIVQADLGVKEITRYSSTYEEAYEFSQLGVSGSVGGGVVGAGSVKVSVDTLNEVASSNSNFGSELTSFKIGTREIPLPIMIHLKPITEALRHHYWKKLPRGKTYKNLRISEKSKCLAAAVQSYSKSAGRILKDPSITIPLEWPRGTYALPQAKLAGCPDGFTRGCRKQDSEDASGNNVNRFHNTRFLQGQFGIDIEMCYCVRKNDRSNSKFTWPRGQYCIAKRGDYPGDDGFLHGDIKWDDEDWNNKNSHWGDLPDGTYDRDTIIEYWCRNDGSPSTGINLPTDRRFILYAFDRDVCQKVNGMESTKISITFDDENFNNSDSCAGDHPYVANTCSDNHKIHMCHYSRIPSDE